MHQSYTCRFQCPNCGPYFCLKRSNVNLECCPSCDHTLSTNIVQEIREFREGDWLTGSDGETMAYWLDDYLISDYRLLLRLRKFRLFATLCCRHIWDEFRHEECWRAVEVAEDFADNLATESDRKIAWRNVHTVTSKTGMVGIGWAAVNAVGEQPYARFFAPYVIKYGKQGGEKNLVARWLIDIFGNPYRPITLNPSWLTSTVLSLATGIYDEKAFDRMPILADALQDAGCDNAEILNHCRQPGEHVRGCWAVDLLLDKK
jgi:hypothetical protein